MFFQYSIDNHIRWITYATSKFMDISQPPTSGRKFIDTGECTLSWI